MADMNIVLEGSLKHREGKKVSSRFRWISFAVDESLDIYLTFETFLSLPVEAAVVCRT